MYNVTPTPLPATDTTTLTPSCQIPTGNHHRRHHQHHHFTPSPLTIKCAQPYHSQLPPCLSVSYSLSLPSCLVFSLPPSPISITSPITINIIKTSSWIYQPLPLSTPANSLPLSSPPPSHHYHHLHRHYPQSRSPTFSLDL
ncbi:hypothetical protein Pmani_014477 [Petrolisthes manimaculis]|uniref:Uncharacterized protein n=1 Tax=Petrolisthes manimaculis TaxID=1843537 RepID=A0AAE1PVP0_9EUCA|nr:hypothetical protein Pmani_014477 [Petrolisthes manimaculis]